MIDGLSNFAYRRAVLKSGLNPLSKLALLAFVETYEESDVFNPDATAAYLGMPADLIRLSLEAAEDAGWIKTENVVRFTLTMPEAAP